MLEMSLGKILGFFNHEKSFSASEITYKSLIYRRHCKYFAINYLINVTFRNQF